MKIFQTPVITALPAQSGRDKNASPHLLTKLILLGGGGVWVSIGSKFG